MKRTIVAIALLTMTAWLPQQAAAQNNTLGGAIVGGVVGGVIGGAATGRAEGALVGAVIGGAAGAAIGSQSERRQGHYWHRGGCYQRVQGGYVQVAPRRCGYY
jgi:outer membrane lipoprotein SlyB